MQADFTGYRAGPRRKARLPGDFKLRGQAKAAIFAPMHFSKHITESHSTFSLLAALKLRVAR